MLAILRETSFGGVTAFLSSVLLQATPSHHTDAQAPQQLPRRFLPAAHAVFCIINDAFVHSREQAQDLLAARDMRTELLYCVSSVVAYCTENWGEGRDTEVGFRQHCGLYCHLTSWIARRKVSVLQWSAHQDAHDA